MTTADRLWWSRSTRIGRLKSTVFADLDHRGLRFVAMDADWSAGDGDEVRGPLLSIVLVLTGRPVGADALAGPGASQLGQRLSSSSRRGKSQSAIRFVHRDGSTRPSRVGPGGRTMTQAAAGADGDGRGLQR